MSSKNAKTLVYRYNGDEASDEVEEDLDGVLPTPQALDVIILKGKKWRVVHKIIESSAVGALPIVRLYLSDTL